MENILLDFDAAEVVHIDYNMAFERGRSLRVPETVPFRLTRNIIGALGLTGVDGTFKYKCCQILEKLRGHSDALEAYMACMLRSLKLELPTINTHDRLSDAAVIRNVSQVPSEFTLSQTEEHKGQNTSDEANSRQCNEKYASQIL